MIGVTVRRKCETSHNLSRTMSSKPRVTLLGISALVSLVPRTCKTHMGVGNQVVQIRSLGDHGNIS